MSDVAKIVLGAFLAVMTSLLVEAVRWRITESRSKRLFRTLLRFEIPDIAAIIDKLVDDVGRVHFFPFTRLNEIEGARQGFDRNRDWIIPFADNTARRDVYEFYRELRTAYSEAMGAENSVLMPMYQQNVAQYQPYVQNERQRLTDKFRTLADKARKSCRPDRRTKVARDSEESRERINHPAYRKYFIDKGKDVPVERTRVR